jgi:hypothetical protein
VFFSPFVFLSFFFYQWKKKKPFPKTPTIQNCKLLHPTKVSSTLPLEKLEARSLKLEVSKSKQKKQKLPNSQTPKLPNAISLNAQKTH